MGYDNRINLPKEVTKKKYYNISKKQWVYECKYKGNFCLIIPNLQSPGTLTIEYNDHYYSANIQTIKSKLLDWVRWVDGKLRTYKEMDELLGIV